MSRYFTGIAVLLKPDPSSTIVEDDGGYGTAGAIDQRPKYCEPVVEEAKSLGALVLDDACASEHAEDAHAHDLEQMGDVAIVEGGERVKDGLAIVVRSEDAVECNGVQMRIESQVGLVHCATVTAPLRPASAWCAGTRRRWIFPRSCRCTRRMIRRTSG